MPVLMIGIRRNAAKCCAHRDSVKKSQPAGASRLDGNVGDAVGVTTQ